MEEKFRQYDKSLEIIMINAWSIAKRTNNKIYITGIDFKNKGHLTALKVLNDAHLIWNIEVVLDISKFKRFFVKAARPFSVLKKSFKHSKNKTYYQLEQLIASSCLGSKLSREEFNDIYDAYYNKI